MEILLLSKFTIFFHITILLSKKECIFTSYKFGGKYFGKFN